MTERERFEKWVFADGLGLHMDQKWEAWQARAALETGGGDMNDLISRLRLLESDHEPEGYPSVKMKEISALLDTCEALIAENQHLRREVRAILKDIKNYAKRHLNL